jgi:hypothetical protein
MRLGLTWHGPRKFVGHVANWRTYAGFEVVLFPFSSPSHFFLLSCFLIRFVSPRHPLPPLTPAAGPGAPAVRRLTPLPLGRPSMTRVPPAPAPRALGVMPRLPCRAVPPSTPWAPGVVPPAVNNNYSVVIGETWRCIFSPFGSVKLCCTENSASGVEVPSWHAKRKCEDILFFNCRNR